MNYTLQLHSNNRTYPVPRGLHDLMADIAREVLRNKPQSIEKFIFKYLDSLMKIRRVAKGVSAEVDKTINAAAKRKLMLEDLGITTEEADRAASKMQAVVRGHMARKEVKELLLKKDSKKVSHLDINYMTSNILKKYRLTAVQAHNICTRIQAFVRGWLVRKRKLSIIPSHESWRHDWLWKEFQMSPEEVKAAVTHTERTHHAKDEDILFQPRRSIDVDHIKFMKAFKGELADYDDRSDTSTIEDFSEAEITEELSKYSEAMKEELEEEEQFGEEDHHEEMGEGEYDDYFGDGSSLLKIVHEKPTEKEEHDQEEEYEIQDEEYDILEEELEKEIRLKKEKLTQGLIELEQLHEEESAVETIGNDEEEIPEADQPITEGTIDEE